jgi:hypothetical protein
VLREVEGLGRRGDVGDVDLVMAVSVFRPARPVSSPAWMALRRW